MLIYQVDNGSDNSGKLPSGGVIGLWTVASSMSVVVANPITYYGTYVTEVINIIGQSGDLYNYYWSSYSRGTDGEGHWNATPVNKPNVHNLYLDSYIPLRHKSIYDPCPYGYRIPSNGTYNQFNSNPGWIRYSYIGGVNWINSWIATTGSKIGYYNHVGTSIAIYSSTPNQTNQSYAYIQIVGNLMLNSWSAKSAGSSVRCIEECELLPARNYNFGELKLKTIKKPSYDTTKLYRKKAFFN